MLWMCLLEVYKCEAIWHSDHKKQSAKAISEIPDTGTSESGGGKSKGVNLFLARQKLIADMMAAEEEEVKAAEGDASVLGTCMTACDKRVCLILACVWLG